MYASMFSEGQAIKVSANQYNGSVWCALQDSHNNTLTLHTNSVLELVQIVGDLYEKVCILNASVRQEEEQARARQNSEDMLEESLARLTVADETVDLQAEPAEEQAGPDAQ